MGWVGGYECIHIFFIRKAAECLYFPRRIHKRYRELNTELIPEDFTELEVQPKLKYKFLQQLPELKVSNCKSWQGFKLNKRF